MLEPDLSIVQIGPAIDIPEARRPALLRLPDARLREDDDIVGGNRYLNVAVARSIPVGRALALRDERHLCDFTQAVP